MPIPRDVTFKCPKCGYTLTKTIGDVIYPMDFLVNCPKCGNRMIMTNGISILDKLKNLFK